MDLISINLKLSLSEETEKRQTAENYLENAKKNRNYSFHLLNIVEHSKEPIVKWAAAIAYKNLVKDKQMVSFFF